MCCAFELSCKSGWVNVWKIIDSFSFLLDAVHINAVSNSHMKACPFEYFIRTHFLWRLHYFWQFFYFLFLIFMDNSQWQSFSLILYRRGLRFESLIDLKLTTETTSHVLRKERNVSKEWIYLIPLIDKLGINSIHWRVKQSSIICDIKRISDWVIIYYILFRGVFPFIKGTSRYWSGLAGAKGMRAFLTFLLGPYFSVHTFQLG